MSQSNVNPGNDFNSIARSQFEQEQFEQAEESLRQALNIARETNDQELEATTLNNLGLVFKSREQYSEALELYQQSLIIYQQLGDRLPQAEVLDNTGFVYYSLTQYLEALGAYQEALAIYLDLDNLDGKTRILQNMLSVIEIFLGESESSSEATIESAMAGSIARTARPPVDRIWRP